MAVRKKTSTTRLPQSLQQQLDEAASTSTSGLFSMHPYPFGFTQNHSAYNHSRDRNGRKSRFAPASRKDTRKQERLARKQNKAVFFSNSHTSNARKRGAEEELVESPQRKKLKLHKSNTANIPKVAKSPPAQVVQDISPTTAPETAAATKGPALQSFKKKSSIVKLKPPLNEDKEDAYIAYLESKLGMDKGGKKKGKKVAEEDGLDGTLQCFSIPYFDLERSYWSRSHGLGGFVCGASHKSKFAWFVNMIY